MWLAKGCNMARCGLNSEWIMDYSCCEFGGWMKYALLHVLSLTKNTYLLPEQVSWTLNWLFQDLYNFHVFLYSLGIMLGVLLALAFSKWISCQLSWLLVLASLVYLIKVIGRLLGIWKWPCLIKINVTNTTSTTTSSHESCLGINFNKILVNLCTVSISFWARFQIAYTVIYTKH